MSFNRYNAWYQNAGRLEMITSHVVDEATLWNSKHQKLVLMSEYGADTVEGMHSVRLFRALIEVIFVPKGNVLFISVASFYLVRRISARAILQTF